MYPCGGDFENPQPSPHGVTRASPGLLRGFRPWLRATRSSPSSTTCSTSARSPTTGPNGLQVPGSESVELRRDRRVRPPRAVRAGRRGRRPARDRHHGLFWDFHPRTVSPAMKERLRILFDADMSLAGYHLPLDAHPEVGNNALICAALGFERAEPFGEHRGRSVGFVGRSAEGVPVRGAARALCGHVRPGAVRLGLGPGARAQRRHRLGRRRVEPRRGGGAGPRRLPHRRARRARDGGRARERHPLHRGRATTRPRRSACAASGELVAERFGVEHRFVDTPNPI